MLGLKVKNKNGTHDREAKFMDVLKLFKHLESSLSRAGARISHILLFLVSFLCF